MPTATAAIVALAGRFPGRSPRRAGGGWVETTHGAETGGQLGRNHPTAPAALENLLP